MSSSNFRFLSNESEHILAFVSSSKGLKAKVFEHGQMQITQGNDGKVLSVNPFDISEVLRRLDNDSNEFLQLNFTNGTKVLLTTELIGFKPIPPGGLDLNKLPKVVTTPDLKSVADAIEDCVAGDSSDSELEILIKVYLAILLGAERVGFNVAEQRQFLHRITSSRLKASA